MLALNIYFLLGELSEETDSSDSKFAALVPQKGLHNVSTVRPPVD
jgi:hypothetical protein